MDEQGYVVVMDTELGVTITPRSGTVEQGIRAGSVDDMLHYNDRLLGELPVKVADIDVIPSLELHEITKNSCSGTVIANTTRFGEPNFRSLMRDDIQIELSPDTAQILDNDQLIYNCWYQLYIDNVHQLLVRPSKWERTGRLPQINGSLAGLLQQRLGVHRSPMSVNPRVLAPPF